MNEDTELLEYHCTNCGNRVNRNDTKCPACGAELEGFIDEEYGSDQFTLEDETLQEQSKIQEFFCAECGTKINEDDTVCPNCGAKLDNTEDYENDITIELKKYTNDVDAELAKSLLLAEGVECYLKGGNSLGTVFNPHPIRLVVLKRDMKRALEILDS